MATNFFRIGYLFEKFGSQVAIREKLHFTPWGCCLLAWALMHLDSLLQEENALIDCNDNSITPVFHKLRKIYVLKAEFTTKHSKFQNSWSFSPCAEQGHEGKYIHIKYTWMPAGSEYCSFSQTKRSILSIFTFSSSLWLNFWLIIEPTIDRDCSVHKMSNIQSSHIHLKRFSTVLLPTVTIE